MSSILDFVSRPGRAVLEFARSWATALIVAGGLAVTFALAYSIHTEERDHIRRTVRGEAEAVSRAVESAVNAHIDSLIEIVERWRVHKPSMADWEADARMQLAHSPGLEAIEWVDSSFKTQWSIYKGAKKVIDREAVFGEPPETALKRARDRTSPTVTRVIDLPHGGTGILIYVPIVAGANADRFDGFIGTVLNVQATMNGLLDIYLLRRYDLEIFEGEKLIYSRPGAQEETDKDWTQEAEMELHGVFWLGSLWKIRLWPTPKWVAEIHSRLELATLVTGVVATGFLVLLVRLFSLARLRASQLERANADLKIEIAERQRAQAMLADFTAMVVHDLRAPLNNVIGVLAMMRDGAFGPIGAEQAIWLDSVEKSGRGLVEMIGNYLDASKLESVGIELVKEDIDLGQLLRARLDGFMPAAQKKGIVLKDEVDPALPRVNADPRKLEQVLTNLLSNALKFTESGTITVTARLPPPMQGSGGAREHGSTIEVAISDTGVGVAAEEIGGVFEKYKQTASGATSAHKGTGLGLFICKMIVEAHGGTIRAESEEGKGTTMIVTLPV